MEADLHCEFQGTRGSTAYRTMRQDLPWKVIRGFPQPGGECLLHLNNVSGGVFGGDKLTFEARLGAAAEVQITTTGATRLYRPRREAAETLLRSRFWLGKGSLLEYLPDALIPYGNVRAAQHTSFTMEDGATLFAWDVVAPGRVAHGERFAFERLQLTTEVHAAGEPVLLDRLLLEPGRWKVATHGRFGTSGSGHLVTFLAVQAGASASVLRALEGSLNRLLAKHDLLQEGDFWGASTLSKDGIIVRGLAQSSLHVPAVLNSLWSHAKQALLGRKAVAPRKTY